MKRLYKLLKAKKEYLEVSSITDWNGYRFGPSSWHYLEDLVRQLKWNPKITLKETNYYKFFSHPRIKTTRYLDDQLFFFQDRPIDPKSTPFYLNTFPWGDFSCRFAEKGGRPSGKAYDDDTGKNTEEWASEDVGRFVWYNPANEEALEGQFNKIRSLFLKIQKEGYHPVRNLVPPIRVAVMIRKNGERLFVRCDGLHRLPILSCLGVKKIWVQIPKDQCIVRENEVDSWYYVRSGQCSRKRALEIFNVFFDFNGRERAKALGISTEY